ncbi:chromate efflux transporter [Pleomorphomonas oryzae]|uniref:chromate efflux transporter n=1 Tax=Pleomorphomonas oryzae TaxID=261934 RepID=UPI000400629E|nr:chromate efflux transporter [Pleomorphomonas oryzae]
MADQVVGSGEEGARGNAVEVFSTFLKLGLTSFGGPIAHLGYFREELVVRRRWLNDQTYADLVALCQFLPGPTSSQVGFSLGMMRAGWLGALSAFLAFTLPSALILLLFALAAPTIGGPMGTGALHGLKIVAVAIVAQAVWGMARNLCPDRQRSTIAVAAVALMAFVPGSVGMLGAIVLGAAGGLALGREEVKPAGGHVTVPVSRWAAVAAILAFLALLVLLPLLAGHSQAFAVVDRFYRAGALVFGGGHVVLPLLDAEVVRGGWVTHDAFLAGYGAAQAVPGPLFTFAAYLGAVLGPAPNGVMGGGLALLAIFLPGFLVLIGILPFWDQFRTKSVAQSLMRGANAAVVGILGTALYSPVFASAILDLRDFALALAGFVALMVWKAPPWLVVAFSAVAGAGLALSG